MQSFAVIPAAGRSRRMGRPKLLLPWGKSTIIEQVLEAWRRSTVTRVVMVVHPDDAQLAAVAQKQDALVVQPEEAPPEMKDSVRVGLRAIDKQFSPSDDDVWLLAPADMPTLSADVIDQLLAAYGQCVAAGNVERATIWAPTFEGRRGHPVLFPWPLAAEVASLSAEEGINALVRRHTVRTVEAASGAIHDDLDTPEDYRRLLADGKISNHAGPADEAEV